jgi:hypothetical protein
MSRSNCQETLSDLDLCMSTSLQRSHVTYGPQLYALNHNHKGRKSSAQDLTIKKTSSLYTSPSSRKAPAAQRPNNAQEGEKNYQVTSRASERKKGSQVKSFKNSKGNETRRNGNQHGRVKEQKVKKRLEHEMEKAKESIRYHKSASPQEKSKK